MNIQLNTEDMGTNRTEQEDLKDLILSLGVLALLCILTAVAYGCGYKNATPITNVSLPEEISQAKEGTLLRVEKVSDSVYIGFDNSIEERAAKEIDKGNLTIEEVKEHFEGTCFVKDDFFCNL